MRYLLGVLLIILSGCGGSSGEAPKPVQPAIPPQAVIGPVVFIGDSITAGWDVAKYIPGAVNVGISGDTTSGMLTRFSADVLSRHPSIVIILGGTNDLPGTTVANPVNIWYMVQAAMSANAKVIVGTLTPTDSTARPDNLIRDFNAQLRTATPQYGYTLVDYYPAMLKADGTMDASLFKDGLHPNQAGYDAMWNVLRPVLQRVGADL